jgi:essential recombination protein
MENITEIAKAFNKAQSEMTNAQKNSTNPFIKNKYADLNSVREAVIPVLTKHNISVLQPTVVVDGKNYVKTVLLHESGQTIESLTEIIYIQGNAQSQGSGITYARRYGLQSLVCIGADDDDGYKAMHEPPKELKWLNILDKNKSYTAQWINVVEAIKSGKIKSIEPIKEKYKLTKEVEMQINNIFNQINQ